MRLDGVGIQGHWLIDVRRSRRRSRRASRRTPPGLKVMITELDVDPLPRARAAAPTSAPPRREGLDPYKDGLPDDVQQKLADRYRELFDDRSQKYPACHARDALGRRRRQLVAEQLAVEGPHEPPAAVGPQPGAQAGGTARSSRR